MSTSPIDPSSPPAATTPPDIEPLPAPHPAPRRAPRPAPRRRSNWAETHPHTLGPRLQQEWEHLAIRPAVLRHVDSWGVTTPIRDLDELLVRVGFGVAMTRESEALLRQLVLLAAHDELAGRVVLQRILPGLLALTARRERHAQREVLEELVGAAWITIRTFNPSRQPSCLAAALISGADYRAFRAARRRRAAVERPIGNGLIDEFPALDQAGALEQLAAVIREARRAGLDDADVEFVRQLVRSGSPSQAAADLRVTPRTIRNRRDQLTRRLRRAVLAA